MKNKILYIDDEPINLKLFEINLKRKYEVVSSNGAYEGLEILKSHQDIMVVLSDMKMPGMNGLEFVKKAKKLYPEKKFIILTGFDITDEIQQALETGLIEKYLGKPYSFNEIDDTIQKTFSEL